MLVLTGKLFKGESFIADIEQIRFQNNTADASGLRVWYGTGMAKAGQSVPFSFVGREPLRLEMDNGLSGNLILKSSRNETEIAFAWNGPPPDAAPTQTNRRRG